MKSIQLGLLNVAVVLPLISPSFGQDVAGSWSGPFKSNGPAGMFEMAFFRTRVDQSGEVTLKFDGKEAKGTARDLRLDGDKLIFSSDVADSDFRFTASLLNSRLIGTFEVFEKGKRTAVGSFCLAKDGAAKCADSDIPAIPTIPTATQRVDDEYDTSVVRPAFLVDGPRVLIDEAHKNFHKATSTFKPFASLLASDGYRITANTDAFSYDLLKRYDLLVIANARGEANGSAFTDKEIDAIEQWIRDGGSMLLIADHTPFGGYSEKLAQRFGVHMSKGYTDDPNNRDPVIKDLLFSRDNKLLSTHSITDGRDASERITRVVSFTGQSLKAPTGVPILKLADSAYDEFPGSEHKIPAAGRAQAIALTFGKGRIFVSGEAAMFTAQISADDKKFGMNLPGIDNRQFTLNVVHWLSRVLQ